MRTFDREANEQRTVRKAQQLSKETLYDKEQITGLKLSDQPEFADLKITSLAAVIALGNTAKSVKSYLTKLWDVLSGHADLTTDAHGGIVADDDGRLSDARSIAFVAAPATASSAGTAGSVAYDGSYLYVCTATNTWKRTALITW